MARAGTASGQETRRRILDAVIETLRRAGVAGATARAIGRTGGFNQALTFYHFGSLPAALLAAADDVTARRLPVYRAALAGATTPAAVADAVEPLLAEDLRSGDLPALAGLVAGSTSPELRDGVVARLAGWRRLAEEVATRTGAGRAGAGQAGAGDVAVAAVAGALGLGLLARLGDDPTPEALAGAAARLLVRAPG